MTEATDNTARHRYEMVVDDSIAYVTYLLTDDQLLLIHTEVPEALGGRGVGSTLARSVLEDARRRGLRIVPECPFIASFIKRHPEFGDLVVEPDPGGMP